MQARCIYTVIFIGTYMNEMRFDVNEDKIYVEYYILYSNIPQPDVGGKIPQQYNKTHSTK